MPARTRPTTERTPGRRWLVPRYVGAAAASASTASWRTFDGPEQNRPSRGSSSVGMRTSPGSRAAGAMPSRLAIAACRSGKGFGAVVSGWAAPARTLLGPDLRVPAGPLAPGPTTRHRAVQHPVERVAVREGEQDVPGDDQEQADREPVVDERRAGPPRVGEVPEPVHDRAGREHHEDRRADERRVELLPRVELVEPHTAVTAACAHPAEVVGDPAAQPAHVGPQLTARAQAQRDEQRDGKG